jgi:CRISPR-associated protein Cmr2
MRSTEAPSGGAGAGVELFKTKIAALLHDPPHKPWLENHEEVAKRWIQQLTGEKDIPEVVRRADRLASSVDRYLLSLLMGEKYLRGFLRCERVVLKNTVNPLFEKEVEQVKEEDAESFFKELHEILKELDAKWKYFALYALYELLWISRGLSVGPADTRVPTHTTFDHDYATAAAVNWVAGERVDGYLLGIDVAGVQEFIGSSRKLRDLWVSSYLVSLFVWYAILPLIEEWGPDVVVIPSLRMNPFFLHWLAEKLSGRAQDELKRLVKEYVFPSEELRKQYELLKMPPYAALPERAVLALPPQAVQSEEKVREFVTERVSKAWRTLWEGARRLARERARDDLTWRFISKAFDYYSERFGDAGFDSIALLALRVHVERVDGGKEQWRIYDDVYRRLAKRFSEAKRVRVDAQARLKLYELTKQAFAEGLGYPRPSARGFEYCTSCGALPALVVLPPGEGPDEFGYFIYKVVERGASPEEAREAWRRGEASELEEFKKWYEEKRRELDRLKIVFTPGERLCPWCFLKRVISLEPQLLRLLLEGREGQKADDLVAEVAKRPSSFKMPSTADVAIYKLLEELARAVESREVGEDQRLLEEALKKTVPRVEWEEISKGVSVVWPAQKKLDERAERLKTPEDIILLKLIIRWDPESLFFSTYPEVRDRWGEVLRKMGLAKWLWSYYALILADGDSISDLLNGRVSAFFGVSWGSEAEGVSKDAINDLKKELIRRSAACEFERVLEAAIGALEGYAEEDKWIGEWSKLLSSKHDINEADVSSRLKAFLDGLKNIIKEEDRIPVSFAYHAAVSAALTRAGLLDAATIAELDGFTVYSGGDDLMAVVPVHKAVKVVSETRAHFAGTCKSKHQWSGKVKVEGGFVIVGRAALPALPGVGRSYAINVAHYVYPLQLVLDDARQALDEAKSEICTRYVEERGVRVLYKDVAVFVYTPRGRGDSTVVPCTLARVTWETAQDPLELYLKRVAEPLECVDRLLERLKPLSPDPEFSVSLLYDVERYSEPLNSITEGELSRRLTEYILRRNINARFASEAQSIINGVFGVLMEPLSVATVHMRGDKGDKGEKVFVNIIRAVRFVRGGMRAWR